MKRVLPLLAIAAVVLFFILNGDEVEPALSKNCVDALTEGIIKGFRPYSMSSKSSSGSSR